MSKADVVYDFLLDGVIRGVWLPGDRINDKEIAEHLGVNRLAAREALSRLIQNEVVEQEQWKGYHIRRVTKQDVLSMVQVRISLEELAMRLFLTKSDEIQTATLKEMYRTIITSKEYLAEGDHVKFMEIDFTFHELLYEASGNHMIAKVIGHTRLTTSIMRNISMGKEPEKFRQAAIISSDEHLRIYEALVEKDIEAANAALNSHLGVTFVTNILKNLNQ